MKQQLTPPQLRIILVLAFIITIALGIGGFMLLRNMLVAEASAIADITSEVKGLSNNIRSLKNAEKTLTENQDIEIKARDMVAESKSYQYQDRIVTDLKDMATSSGVVIKNVDFATEQTNTSTAPQQQDNGGIATPTTALPSGINQIKATITIESPVAYDNLLLFIRSLENNNMKMQISKVAITGAGASDGSNNDKNQVTSDAFIIGVYIR